MMHDEHIITFPNGDKHIGYLLDGLKYDTWHLF